MSNAGLQPVSGCPLAALAGNLDRVQAPLPSTGCSLAGARTRRVSVQGKPVFRADWRAAAFGNRAVARMGAAAFDLQATAAAMTWPNCPIGTFGNSACDQLFSMECLRNPRPAGQVRTGMFSGLSRLPQWRPADSGAHGCRSAIEGHDQPRSALEFNRFPPLRQQTMQQRQDTNNCRRMPKPCKSESSMPRQ